MESKFQTSFIPKKPIPLASTTNQPKRVGFTTIASSIVILVVLALGVGVFMWQTLLQGEITKMKAEIDKAKSSFEPALIAKLARADLRIESGKQLINQHLALSTFFDTVGELTLKGVRFTSFDYQQLGQRVVVSMDGQGQSYSTMALQSDLFLKNKTYLQEPNISGLTLDQKTGFIMFKFTATIDPSVVSYKKSLTTMPTIDTSFDPAKPAIASTTPPVMKQGTTTQATSTQASTTKARIK